MSELERLAGAVLCVGVSGDVPDPEVLDELARVRPGGVVLFARNVSTVARTRALIAALRATCAGAYVAVDQEGGRVARLRDGATDVPSMMALGATYDPSLAERVGETLAADLARFDCDLDFAPVCDLATDPRGSVVGTRSFGDDPERVGAFAFALARGLQRGGAGATLKHFPGHGATSVDSHVALPVVDASLEQLRAREFVPFARALATEPVAVMSAHVVTRALDAERPATLSPRVLRDTLRGELGFRGACVSDCLEMAAIAGGHGTVDGALAALEAGCDVLIVSHTLAIAREIRDGIVRAVERGSLSRARLEEAALRVVTLRDRMRALRVAAEARELSGDDDARRERGRALALEVARRAVTLVRGDVRLALDVPVTVVSFEAATEDGIAGVRRDYASVSHALRTRGVRSELLRVPLEPEPDAVEHLIDLVAMQGRRRVVVIARRAWHHPAQAAAVDAIVARFADAVLVVAAEPFDVSRFPAFAHVACTYGDGASAFEGLADVLVGRIAATGRLPVDLARAGAVGANA